MGAGAAIVPAPSRRQIKPQAAGHRHFEHRAYLKLIKPRVRKTPLKQPLYETLRQEVEERPAATPVPQSLNKPAPIAGGYLKK